MKKIVLLLVFITSFIFLLYLFLSPGSTYNDFVLSQRKIDNLIVSKKKIEDNVVKNMRFNNYDLFYDDSTNTFYYSLIEKRGNAYNPTISYDVKKQYKLAINKKITDKVIKENESIQLIFYNNNNYIIYNLKCTTLPLININTEKNIGREDVKMSVSLFDNRKSSTRRTVLSDGLIHVRGKSSSVRPKKSYKISLTNESLGNHKRKNNISLLGMRADDDWILYAPYNDQEKIRNVFASKLWYDISDNNSFNTKFGYQYKYVELFINNKYHGLYALGYKIDKKLLKINNNDEYLFQKTNWEKSEVTILENDSDTLAGYELKNANNNEEEAWDTLKKYYRSLQTTDDLSVIYSMIDIDNVVDVYLFNNLVAGVDNIDGSRQKNIYISFKKNNDNMIAIYIPWDLDLTFGNTFAENKKNSVVEYMVPYNYEIGMNIFPISFLQKIDSQAINNIIKKRYNELRNDLWSKNNINHLIDYYETEIYDSGSFARDVERWPDTTHNNNDEGLKNFRDWIMNRLDYLDNKILSN